MNARKHVLITGTGRAGTSFLMELLTNLGLDTGFKIEELNNFQFDNARAGLENDIRSNKCPYIVKNPKFCDHAEDVFSRNDILIEHIFVPIRNLNAAAESRRFVTRTGIKKARIKEKILYKLGLRKIDFKGGLWHTNSTKSGNQELTLLNQLYYLMFAISNSDTKLTLIRYPRLTKDPNYLYLKLRPILNKITQEEFSKIFEETVKPELVNKFNKDDD